MTLYEKQLVKIIDAHYGELNTKNLLEKLIKMGVVDYTRCKILAVRNVVDEMVKKGMKKSDAMWSAAEQFACSYEYIRKCMYYYTDVNII